MHSEAVCIYEGLQNGNFVQYWVSLLARLIFAISPPSLLLILARFLEAFDFGHETGFLLLCALLNKLDAMLCEKGLENIHFVACWVSILALLGITESPPGLLPLFTGSLECLDLDDDFAFCKILLRGALNTLDAMLCEKGLEKTFFVPCRISARTLTISERPPYLLILFAGPLEILDLADEFALNLIAREAIFLASFALAPAFATPGTRCHSHHSHVRCHSHALEEVHEYGGANVATTSVAVALPRSLFHHGSDKEYLAGQS